MLPDRCELCPRRCGVNRAAGERGYCRAGDSVEVFRYGAHHGEEPPVSGERGSGTVFFSRCTLKCLYCQNFPWSQEGRGEPLSVGQLAGVFKRLRDADRCHNWNLVSPTPWLPLVREALDEAKRDGGAIPVVVNTSGFERVEVLAGCEDWVDLYLTDLRYSREDSARAGSDSGAYVAAARAALLEMWRQKGPVETDDGGVAVKGTICRLLILPGLANEAVENLEWLAGHVGNGIAVSVMAQYVPAHRAPGLVPWKRRITREEYELVCEAVERLGFSEGWIQDFEGPAAEELIGFQMKAGPGEQERE